MNPNVLFVILSSTTFAIVPADLRSAGIYYKDLQIRLKIPLVLSEKQAQKRN